MLNELAIVKQTLEKCGIETISKHPAIKNPAKEEGFLFGIDKVSKIATAEYCNAEQFVSFWQYMPNKFNRFPVFKLKAPLFRPICSDIETHKFFEKPESEEDRNNFIQELTSEYHFTYSKKDFTALEGRLVKFPKEIESILNSVGDEKDGLKELREIIKRIIRFDNPENFLRQIADVLIKFHKSGDFPEWKLIEKLLVGKWNAKKSVYTKIEVPLILDLADYEDFEKRITDKTIGDELGVVLFNSKSDTKNTGICSITGNEDNIQKSTFPEPKLPVIGPSLLFAMNKDAPCHFRYGKIASEIFPVGVEISNGLQDVILFLADEKRKEKTWSKIPSTNVKSPDLLFAFLENMPDIPAPVTSLFGEPESDSVKHGVYEELASDVCKALKSKVANQENTSVRIFILSKADKARRQVVYSSSFSVANILSGVKSWQSASKNHPPFTTILPKSKGKKAEIVKPACPSPGRMLSILQHQWIRQGTEKKKKNREKQPLPGCRLSDIYDVFLGDEPICTQTAHRLLGLMIKRLSPLLIGIGEADHKSQVDKYLVDTRRTTLGAIATIAILLSKTGHQKEVYMNETAFNIGRLLSLADILHKEYCKNVRQDDIPPNLIGNSIMPSVADNPQRGLARLCDRLRVYKAWADTAKGDKVGLAKWALKEMGSVSALLAQKKLDKKMDDADKAQLLLGYLAKFGKSDKDSE